jgi:DNA-binding transcriptional LysR family regulator
MLACRIGDASGVLGLPSTKRETMPTAASTAGLGIALLPDHVCGEALGNAQLVHVLLDWSGQQGILHIVFTTRRGLPPAVRAISPRTRPRAISRPGLANEASR